MYVQFTKTALNLKRRRLFQRVTSIKFSSKKMKFIFKKWLMFEKAHGTEDDVEEVKNKAKDYVEGLGV